MVKMRQRNLSVFEFEQGTDEEIVLYIKQNADFMKNHCLAFHNDVSDQLENLMKELDIIFFKVHNNNIFKHSKNHHFLQDNINSKEHQDTIIKKKITFNFDDSKQVITDTIESEEISKETLENKEHSNYEKHLEYNLKENNNFGKNVINSKTLPNIVFNRSIRSGENIVLQSHATFIKTINVGAFIKSQGNLHIYGKCDGILECFGDYIIIKEFNMGRISLQGIDLEGKMLEFVRNSDKFKILTIEGNEISINEI